MRRKPTIDELEKILNKPPQLVRMYRDGSIGIGNKIIISYKITFTFMFFMGILVGLLLGEEQNGFR